VALPADARKYFFNNKELTMKMNLMPISYPLHGFILALLALSLPMALTAQAADGISVKVETFLSAELISGPHYTMAPKAEIRRAIAFYNLDTSYGKTKVSGTVALLERIDELGAIATLEKMKKTDVYTDAVKKSAGGPLDTGKALVDDPVGTVSDTAKGLGSFLSDVGYSIVSDDPSQENVAKTALGFGAAKRKLAHQLGVNPYSSFEPLQDHMSEIAWTMVGGGLTITAAFSQIGNTAGQVVRITAGSNKARMLVRDKSPRELRNHNIEALEGMGVSEDLAEAVLDNHNFDPEAITRIVVALLGLEGVDGRGDLVGRIALVATPSQATKARDWMELLASYHVTVAAGKSLIIVSTTPFLVDAKGTVHGVFPTDYITTEPAIETAIGTVSKAVAAKNLKLGPFYATGKIDSKMEGMLRNAGWTGVHDHAEKILRKD
jgi:hypothetical protein